MNELNKRKKEFLKAYNNLCSCYGDIISEQTKVSCNILAEKVKLQKQLAIAVQALKNYADERTWDCCFKNQCAYVDGFEANEAIRKIKELEK